MGSIRISITEKVKLDIALKIERRINRTRIDWLKKSLKSDTLMSHNDRDAELEIMGVNILIDIKNILGVK